MDVDSNSSPLGERSESAGEAAGMVTEIEGQYIQSRAVYRSASVEHEIVVENEPMIEEDRGLIQRGILGMVNVGVAAAKLPFQIAKPIVMSEVMTPAREAANSAVGVVVDASVSIVSEHLLDNPEVTQLIEDVTARLLKRLSTSALVAELIRLQAGAYLEYLTANPEILGPLVQDVAGNYIGYLEEHPAELDSLVRIVGDRYLDYLNEEPEQVQQLLAGQTMSISTEIIEEVRERSATADNVVENAVRKLFRMKPRASTSPKGGQAEVQES